MTGGRKKQRILPSAWGWLTPLKKGYGFGKIEGKKK
jgi:hypothetical protein